VICSDQDVVGDRDGGLVLAVAIGAGTGDAPELRLQVAVLGADRRPGRFGERVGEPHVTGVGLARAPLATGLVVPRAHPRPGGEVARRRNATVVAPSVL
jgi:hypothetical protein